MQLTLIDPLPIVLDRPGQGRRQLVLVEAANEGGTGEACTVVLRAGHDRVRTAMDAPAPGRPASIILEVPCRAAAREATVSLVAIGAGGNSESVLSTEKVILSPVPEFTFCIFPSSHMCVAYENTIFLAHHDAARAIGKALQVLTDFPEGVWSIEYTWGLQLYWDKHPEHHDLIRRLVKEGRLEVGARLTPNIQDGLDAESLARQFAEAQWWMQKTFGVNARATFDWDSPIFYPQAPQLMGQAGIAGLVSGCYLDFDEDGDRPQTSRREGSPFFQHIGANGASTTVLAPTRGLQEHYCASGVVGYYTFKMGGGPLRSFAPVAITVEWARKLAVLVRRTREVSGMDFLAGSADCGDQSGPKEELYEKVRAWNSSLASPRIEFLSAARCIEKAAQSGKVGERLDRDIPWWIRQVGNMMVLRYRSNEVASSLIFAETMASLDALALGALYPREALAVAWNELLHAQQHEQFHSAVCNGDDTLDWSRAALARAEAVAESCADVAMSDIASRVSFARFGRPIAVFNRMNWLCQDVVSVPVDVESGCVDVLDERGERVPSKIEETGRWKEVSFVAVAPPLGYASYYLSPTSEPQPVTGDGEVLENKYYRIAADFRTGLVTSIFNKIIEKELVAAGRPSAGFRIAWDDDAPGADHWSISRPNGQTWWQGDFPASSVSVERDGLQQTLVVRGPLLGEGDARFGKWREVRISLTADMPRVDLHIRYLWDAPPDRRAWLYFDLPLSLEKARATYGSPYCAVDYEPFDGDQPSLRRIRTMHNWCDLYDPGRRIGVCLAGPSTQVELRPDGLAVALVSRHGSTPGNLCPGLDGEHSFRYSLYSHLGNWDKGYSARFGSEHEGGHGPLRAVLASPRGGSLPAAQSLLPVSGEGIVVTCVKQANSGEDLIVRAYETWGRPAVLSISRPERFGLSEAWKSNILEECLDRLDVAKLAHIDLAPWEIITLRLRMSPRGKEVADWKT